MAQRQATGDPSTATIIMGNRYFDVYSITKDLPLADIFTSVNIMTEYQCGNCREFSRLGPSARFCPYCGSTSLSLVVREETESKSPVEWVSPEIAEAFGAQINQTRIVVQEEEKKPRRPKQASK